MSRADVKVPVRNEVELKLIRKSGEITAGAMRKTLESVRPGITLVELDRIAEDEILRLGGGSSFKSVPGYYWTTCLTINDEVVHGIPRPIKLKKGDILGVDLGAVYQGWHTDSAWSVVVGGSRPEDGQSLVEEEKGKFLKVGEKVLWQAISYAVEGNQIGDISSAIQNGVEGSGFSVVKSLSGHGVGRSAHEEPEIPEYGKAKTGIKLCAGMVLAIEVIYTQGKGEVFEKEDSWTIASKDHSLGGLFEMSVVVGKKKGEVITDWRKV